MTPKAACAERADRSLSRDRRPDLAAASISVIWALKLAPNPSAMRARSASTARSARRRALADQLVVASLELGCELCARPDEAPSHVEPEDHRGHRHHHIELKVGIREALHCGCQQKAPDCQTGRHPAQTVRSPADGVGAQQKRREGRTATDHVSDDQRIEDRAGRQHSGHRERGAPPPQHRERHEQDHRSGGCTAVVAVSAHGPAYEVNPERREGHADGNVTD